MIFPNLVTYHVYDGCFLPPFDAQAYQYILAGNGVSVRAETRFFSALLPVVACDVRGLAALQFEFRLKVPRIPEKLLRAALSDAHCAKRPDGGLNEALYWFHHQSHIVRLRRPPQRVTGASVVAAGDSDPTVLCELHSHGNMSAFWSQTDDADEQGARIYAVIGRLDERPEIRLRLGVYGYWFPLPLHLLFDGPGGFVEITGSKTGRGANDADT